MPVISPWVFYALNVVDGLGVVLLLSIVISIAVSFVGGVMYLAEGNESYGDENLAKYGKKMFKCGIKILIPALIAATFIPGSSTITKMIIAQNVTYERVEEATDVVQSVYEDIMELFEDGETE